MQTIYKLAKYFANFLFYKLANNLQIDKIFLDFLRNIISHAVLWEGG